ncbi:MAG: DUF4292 domain-containing protein [Desulfobacteraceae bacterium]|nr:DUF4292 domain-containing protein [Desulfobacteraceae bacterium]
MNKPFSYLFYIFLFFVILFLSGCSQLKPATDPVMDKKAFALANKAKMVNKTVLTSKGTGWITVKEGKQTRKFRVAWAAAAPGRIRMTLLLFGHPFETIIASGRDVTFVSHTGKHAPHTIRSKDPSLSNFIQIPVRISDIIAFFLGQLPIKHFDAAYFSPEDQTFSTIRLKQNWSVHSQVLTINNQNHATALTVQDNNGKSLYSMAFKDFKTLDTTRIPTRTFILEQNNRLAVIQIDTFKANVQVKESVFRLTEGG